MAGGKSERSNTTEELEAYARENGIEPVRCYSCKHRLEDTCRCYTQEIEYGLWEQKV